MHYASTEDTITAISTPPGEGGIGIVRVSGPDAFVIARAIFVSSKGRTPDKGKQRVFHGHVHDASGRTLDEILLHVMPAPHSYTAEDVVEFNGHGGMVPLNAILEETLRHGARLARPGEFTLRAFLNGRMDLTRAEAVIDLIQAQTRRALSAANSVAEGALSETLYELREILADSLARIEAAVDFPEDDLPELIDHALIQRLQDANKQMKTLLETAETGILLREGVGLAIVGRPNVGKSSLFNALLRDTRAIVSEEAGTTRDRIEETASLGGIPVRLMDTAGMREAQNIVEAQGVQLARDAARQARYILFVVDGSASETDEDRRIAAELRDLGTPVLLIRNKIDLRKGSPLPQEHGFTAPQFALVCDVSAKTGEGLHRLEKELSQLLIGSGSLESHTPMLSRTHQRDSMRRAQACVARMLLDMHISPELLALELREALDALGEITGETTSESLLDRIFSAFCIGK